MNNKNKIQKDNHLKNHLKLKANNMNPNNKLNQKLINYKKWRKMLKILILCLKNWKAWYKLK